LFDFLDGSFFVGKETSGAIGAHHESMEVVAPLGLVSSFIGKEFFVQLFFAMSKFAFFVVGAEASGFELFAEFSFVLFIIDSSLLFGFHGCVEAEGIILVSNRVDWGSVLKGLSWGLSARAIAVLAKGIIDAFSSSDGFARFSGGLAAVFGKDVIPVSETSRNKGAALLVVLGKVADLVEGSSSYGHSIDSRFQKEVK
jgi:hypothetical protein